MNRNENTSTLSRGFLDTFAVSMSLLCAVHCLITPVLLIALPILATTFLVHKDFHLWMMLLVIPTTVIAVNQGCKKHKDKWVVMLSGLGLSILLGISLYESFIHGAEVVQGAHCGNCADLESGSFFTPTIVLNLLGGVFLASAHVRNYMLCRAPRCKK